MHNSHHHNIMAFGYWQWYYVIVSVPVSKCSANYSRHYMHATTVWFLIYVRGRGQTTKKKNDTFATEVNYCTCTGRNMRAALSLVSTSFSMSH